MYRHQRKKSDRTHPYNITSSTNRKSGQFVSPVVNYDLSLSAAKKHRSSLPNLNESNIVSSIQNRSSLDSTHLSKDKIIDKKSRTTIEQPVVETNQTKDQNNEKMNAIEGMINSEQKTNSDEKITSEEKTNIEEKKNIIEEAESKVNAEDVMFDSDLDMLFCNSSLEDKLNQFNGPTHDNESSQESEVYGDEEDLFDSDAIANDDDSLQLDESNNMDEFKIPGMVNSNDLIGKSYKLDDIDFLNELVEEVDDDGIDEELDSTLIFRKSDPILSQYITTPIQHIPEDEKGFKTASGVPIQIRMTEEEQKQRAKILGIAND